MTKGDRMLTLTQLANEYGVKVQVMKNRMVAARIIDPETHLPFQRIVDAGAAALSYTDTPAYGTKPVQYARYQESFVMATIPGPSTEEREARCKDVYELEAKLERLVSGLSKPLGLFRYVSQGIQNANLDKRLVEAGMLPADYEILRQCYLREPAVFGGYGWISGATTEDEKRAAVERFTDKTSRIRKSAERHKEALFTFRVIDLLLVMAARPGAHADTHPAPQSVH